MQTQTSERDPSPEGSIETIQRSALNILVDQNRQRPWALEEIVREYEGVGEQRDVEDALAYLRSAGLIRAIDDCYVATRAAVHAFELGILGI